MNSGGTLVIFSLLSFPNQWRTLHTFDSGTTDGVIKRWNDGAIGNPNAAKYFYGQSQIKKEVIRVEGSDIDKVNGEDTSLTMALSDNVHVLVNKFERPMSFIPQS